VGKVTVLTGYLGTGESLEEKERAGGSRAALRLVVKAWKVMGSGQAKRTKGGKSQGSIRTLGSFLLGEGKVVVVV